MVHHNEYTKLNYLKITMQNTALIKLVFTVFLHL